MLSFLPGAAVVGTSTAALALGYGGMTDDARLGYWSRRRWLYRRLLRRLYRRLLRWPYRGGVPRLRCGRIARLLLLESFPPCPRFRSDRNDGITHRIEDGGSPGFEFYLAFSSKDLRVDEGSAQHKLIALKDVKRLA